MNQRFITSNNRSNLLLICFMITITLAVLINSPQEVHAHRMLIESQSEGVVLIKYDDGTVAAEAEVYLYDETGELVTQGEADGQGFFHFDHNLNYDKIVATDGLGHQTEKTVGEEDFWSGFPLTYRAILGVSFFLGIAAVSYIINHKKTKTDFRE